MAIPSIEDLALPVLRSLGSGKTVSTHEITGRLAEEFGLTERDLSRTRPDGRPLFHNRIQWARTALKKKGLIEYPEPSTSRITLTGVKLLECDPREVEGFIPVPDAPEPEQMSLEQATFQETLEDELRRLSGPAVAKDEDWDVVCRLNGWGPEAAIGYQRLARQLGRDKDELLALGRACRRQRPVDAPLLESALRLVLTRPERDLDALSLDLVRFGLASDGFSLQGLAEAARRFGRFQQWAELVRILSQHRRRARCPRPFGSWFEVDVFLFLNDLGHEVRPQKRVGPYRVDLLLPDFIPQLVIECDGDAFHGADRAKYDELREAKLLEMGYRVMRFKYSDFKARPDSIKQGIVELLSSPQTIGLQTRAG